MYVKTKIINDQFGLRGHVSFRGSGSVFFRPAALYKVAVWTITGKVDDKMLEIAKQKFADKSGIKRSDVL